MPRVAWPTDTRKARSNHRHEFRPTGDALLRAGEQRIGRAVGAALDLIPADPAADLIAGRITAVDFVEQVVAGLEQARPAIEEAIYDAYVAEARDMDARIASAVNDRMRRLGSPVRLAPNAGLAKARTVELKWGERFEQFDRAPRNAPAIITARHETGQILARVATAEQGMVMAQIDAAFTATQTFTTGRTVTGRTTGQVARGIVGILDDLTPAQMTLTPGDLAAYRSRFTNGLFPRWAQAVNNFADTQADLLAARNVGPVRAKNIVEARTARYAQRLRRSRARMIARTEINVVQNRAMLDTMRNAANRGLVSTRSLKEWVTGPIDACPICTGLSGTRIGLNESFVGVGDAPPAHPNCFPAGTVVDGPTPIGAVSRWYEGELVELVTREGRRLAGTANHPVLTPNGWVALGLLRAGDDVISRGGVDRPASGENDDDEPAVIEQVVESFRAAGRVSSVEVPVAAPDFHGDGAGSQVAVVSTDPGLHADLSASFDEQAVEDAFVVGVEAAFDGATFGGGDLAGIGPAESPDGSMGGGGVGTVLLRRPCGHHQTVSVADAAAGDPGFVEATVDDDTRRVESLRERVHRLAPEVSVDDLADCGVDPVVSTRRRSFAGHVYNLETVDGWYTANSIVVHNCRCIIRLVPDIARAPELVGTGVPDDPFRYRFPDGWEGPITPVRGFGVPIPPRPAPTPVAALETPPTAILDPDPPVPVPGVTEGTTGNASIVWDDTGRVWADLTDAERRFLIDWQLDTAARAAVDDFLAASRLGSAPVPGATLPPLPATADDALRAIRRQQEELNDVLRARHRADAIDDVELSDAIKATEADGYLPGRQLDIFDDTLRLGPDDPIPEDYVRQRFFDVVDEVKDAAGRTPGYAEIEQQVTALGRAIIDEAEDRVGVPPGAFGPEDTPLMRLVLGPDPSDEALAGLTHRDVVNAISAPVKRAQKIGDSAGLLDRTRRSLLHVHPTDGDDMVAAWDAVHGPYRQAIADFADGLRGRGIEFPSLSHDSVQAPVDLLRGVMTDLRKGVAGMIDDGTISVADARRLFSDAVADLTAVIVDGKSGFQAETAARIAALRDAGAATRAIDAAEDAAKKFVGRVDEWAEGWAEVEQLRALRVGLAVDATDGERLLAGVGTPPPDLRPAVREILHEVRGFGDETAATGTGVSNGDKVGLKRESSIASSVEALDRVVAAWVPDDWVLRSNTRGTVGFYRQGKRAAYGDESLYRPGMRHHEWNETGDGLINIEQKGIGRDTIEDSIMLHEITHRLQLQHPSHGLIEEAWIARRTTPPPGLADDPRWKWFNGPDSQLEMQDEFVSSYTSKRYDKWGETPGRLYPMESSPMAAQHLRDTRLYSSDRDMADWYAGMLAGV